MIHKEQEKVDMQIDMLRQTQATLSLEGLKVGKAGLDAIEKMLRGDISREGYQKLLKENYKANGMHA